VKIHDDISNGTEDIVLTDKHKNTQTDTIENNTTLAKWVLIKVRCAEAVYSTDLLLVQGP